jgi:hypothetical protein
MSVAACDINRVSLVSSVRRGKWSVEQRIQQAVDIGGRTLNLYCSGEGSPAVILQTGGNEPGYC